MKSYFYIFSFLVIVFPAIGQKTISTEDLWRDYTFFAKSVPGFNFLNDGKHFTRLQDNSIKKYDLTTGAYVEELLSGEALKGKEGFSGSIDAYTFSQDEHRILIKSETQSIYRRSSIAKFHVFDRDSREFIQVWNGEGKIGYATFNPSADKVAYVHENNLYYTDLSNSTITRITNDGVQNKIINGSTDWVYEEEFSFAKAFYWSPDGEKIAFIRFDESEVKEFTMTKYNDGLYPVYETFKYPKVGEQNADVSAHIYYLKEKDIRKLDIEDEKDIYIPRIKWTADKDHIVVFKLNRHQNDLKLYVVDTQKNKSKVLLHETNKYYIDITDDLTFLDDNKHFIWSSEKTGFNHIYLYDMKGNEKKALTYGNYDVTSLYGIDEKNGLVYYQAAEKTPLQKHVYAVDLEGNNKKLITNNSGTNSAQWSSTFDYFVNNYSTINQASTYTVYDRNANLIRIIEDNKNINVLQEEYNTSKVEFFTFTTSEGINLNGWMIKPKDFDASKKYPIFMTQYSGPGSQQVTDSWKGNNYWWYQQIAQEGYIVACVDPRGTGGRGEEFKKMTYLQLGKYETIDQIEAAKYLGALSYTDASRIGIYGWSYGGYMSTLCILKGNDVFKSAIAVAPVTSWKWYDTVYTERFMRTVDENEAGYKENSPVYYANLLKGNYLLVHGIADDNVHFQNSAEMMNALISANKQFDTYAYPNRNHGIYGDNARLHLWTKMNDFIFNKI
ncbi:MAG: S9 family peptidase [Saprospiraceae bacterium]|nr:S9 family peptidase [Saprospiraceae bacterium]